MQETQTLFECKGNMTNLKRLHNTQFMAPLGHEGAFFFKNTLHFHKKVSQKHTKVKIQSPE